MEEVEEELVGGEDGVDLEEQEDQLLDVNYKSGNKSILTNHVFRDEVKTR